MGRREIVGGILFVALGLGGGAMVTAATVPAACQGPLCWAGVAVIVVSVLGLIWLFLTAGAKAHKDADSGHSVTSRDQTGGITAHTVHGALLPSTRANDDDGRPEQGPAAD